MKLKTIFFLFNIFVLFYSCNSYKNLSPISDFDINKYLGKWYEVARINFTYERNMSNISSEFIFDDNNNLLVINRGYNYVQHHWKKTTGKVRNVSDTTGVMKVSFFYPIYFDYIILALDENYNYAMVGTEDLDNLWILSRTTSIPNSIKNQYLTMAKSLGYDTDGMIWTLHNKKKATLNQTNETKLP